MGQRERGLGRKEAYLARVKRALLCAASRRLLDDCSRMNECAVQCSAVRLGDAQNDECGKKSIASEQNEGGKVVAASFAGRVKIGQKDCGSNFSFFFYRRKDGQVGQGRKFLGAPDKQGRAAGSA